MNLNFTYKNLLNLIYIYRRPSTAHFFKSENTSDSEIWKPVKSDNCGIQFPPSLSSNYTENDYDSCQMDMDWLDINVNISIRHNLYEDRMTFWDTLPLHENYEERLIDRD